MHTCHSNISNQPKLSSLVQKLILQTGEGLYYQIFYFECENLGGKFSEGGLTHTIIHAHGCLLKGGDRANVSGGG